MTLLKAASVSGFAMSFDQRDYLRVGSKSFRRTATGPRRIRDFRYLAFGVCIVPLASVFFCQFSEAAFLPADTSLHYVMAFLSAALFMGVSMVLFDRDGVTFRQLFRVTLFTATVGIMLILLLQEIAQQSRNYSVYGTTSGAIIYFILRIIAYSYEASFNPLMDFMPSLLGYTFGVGLCEELMKLLPVLWGLHIGKIKSWEQACLIGFMSGVGFGVGEGIHFSSQAYNGTMPLIVYLIRFVDCVGLHGMCTATAAILIQQANIQQGGWVWFLRVVFTIMPVMVLHALYDTLLKYDLVLLALFTDIAVFFYLAFQIEKARGFAWPSLRLALPKKRAPSPVYMTESQRTEVDRLLEKIYKEGISSLSATEKEWLERTTRGR